MLSNTKAAEKFEDKTPESLTKEIAKEATEIEKGRDIIMPDSVSIDTLTGDTLINDYAVLDSLSKDSTSLIPDTLLVSNGVLPLINQDYVSKVMLANSDTLKEKRVDVRRPYSALALERSPIFKKDTMSFASTILLSTVVPGFGQLYNKDYWKIPVLYSSLAGFITGAALLTPKYKSANRLYTEAAESGASLDVTTARYYTMSQYKSRRNMMWAGAAISYIYFLCDGAVNYKGDIHPTKKATVLSAILPGAGQLYNGKYWKLPIVYGGFATFTYIITYNNRGYQRYKQAYNYRTDDNDKTIDIYDGIASESQLLNTRNSFRRYRDLGIIMAAGFYILQVIDAHVDAYLDMYDVSDDLSLQVQPIYQPSPNLSSKSTSGTFGIGMKLTF